MRFSDYCVLCEKRTELRSFTLFDNPAVLDKACKFCIELEEGLDWNGQLLMETYPCQWIYSQWAD